MKKFSLVALLIAVCTLVLCSAPRAAFATGTSAIQVQSVTGDAGANVVVPIIINSQGDENAVSGSLTYNPAVLTYDSVALGSAATGGSVIPVTSDTSSGEFGFLMQVGVGASLPAGTDQLLLVTFTIAAGATSGNTAIGWGNTPAPEDVTDEEANDLLSSSTFTGGNVTVVGAPTAPTANAQTVAVAFNKATSVVLTGTDTNVPAETLTYAVASQPTDGTLSGTAPNLTYTPTSGYSGSDSFTFTVKNTSNLTSAPATVTLNVAPAGTPTANAQTVAVAFNKATSVTLTATDPNTPAETLTYAVVTQPLHGALSGTAPALTYTPTTGYNGADSFTFTAKNTSGKTSAAATVTLNVAAGTPTATGQSVAVPFNTAKAITLAGSDPNVPVETLTYTVATQPIHGTLTGTAPNLTYTPTSGYSGADSFTFTVTNTSSLTSAAATVAITVGQAGAPTANAQTVAVLFNTATSVTLTVSDPNSPPEALTYTVSTQPADGTLSGTAPNLTYTPTSGFSGADSFTFTAKNTSGVSSPAATVTINVAPDVTTGLTISAPSTATIGTPIAVRVTAVDATGHTVTTYSGTVQITSSDTSATLPANAQLTNGTGTFNVTLKTRGTQTVTATDTVTSAFTATTSAINVVPPILHTFAAGLYMISAPVDDTGISLASQFDQSVALAVWQPSLSTPAYAVSPTPPADTIRLGQGYWARFTAQTDLYDVGTAVSATQPFSISLAAGWNMIGVPDAEAVAASALSVQSNSQTYTFGAAVNAAVISNTLYTYQASDAQYEVISGVNANLQPYYGYWIYAFQPSTLIFAAQ